MSATWSCRRRRRLLEQIEADLLGQLGRVELVPERGHVEQPLGGDEGGGGLAEGRALLLGQLEGAVMPEPVDEAVGDLGGDDFAAQPWLRIASRCCSCIAVREGGEQLGRRASDPRPACLPRSPPAAPSSRSRAATASSGRVRPRFCLRAAEQLLVACRGPRPRGRAGRFPRASRSTADRCGRPCGAAALGDRQRQRLQAVVLEHDARRPRRSSRRGSVLRVLEARAGPRSSRGSAGS